MLKDVRLVLPRFGVLVLIALAITACSGQSETDAGSTDAEPIVTDIKVYESPT